MRKRFIIVTNDAAATVQNAITQAIKNDLGAGWWHHFQNLWLVTTIKDEITTESIRSKIKEIAPGTHHFVFELRDTGSWRGFAPKKMFQWLNATWTDGSEAAPDEDPLKQS